MNIKTTISLVVLVTLGAIGWFVYRDAQPEKISSKTLSFLNEKLTKKNLTAISLRDGDDSVNLQQSNGEWRLPGKWPVRQRPVQDLVELLTSLDTRYVPIFLPEDKKEQKKTLAKYGLDDALKVVVTLGGKKHTLYFGQEPGEKGRFSRTTYLRVDKQNEVIRLAPGLVGQLKHTPEYFQKRRLFDVVRAPSKENKDITVEKLDAATISVNGGGTQYTLTKVGDKWEFKKPYKDRPEPDKLKAILDGIPDVWAETFVEKDVARATLAAGEIGRCGAGTLVAAAALFPGRRMAELGLPDDDVGNTAFGKSLTVKRQNGDITIYVGRKSKSNTRVEMIQMPTQFGPKPKPKFIEEVFYYARLKGNPQIFEIKQDGVKEVFVAFNELRDPKVAQFDNDDVTKIEIDHGKRRIVLVKTEVVSKDDKEKPDDKDKKYEWRLEEPIKQKAEKDQVTELLNKFNGLQPDKKDIVDKAEKSHGLSKDDKATKVVITVKKTEKDGDDEKTTTKAYTFLLGKKDKDKVALQLQGWPRVNLVAEDVLKIAERPAMVYRNRQVLDFDADKLAAIKIEQKDESFTLTHSNDDWKLTEPVETAVETQAVSDLTNKLDGLEVVEYVTDAPKEKDLDIVYGLAKPVLKATITFAGKKNPKTLLIGKQRKDKDDYYAKLTSDDTVFVVKKETREALAMSSLKYRPKEIWRYGFDDLQDIQVSHRKKSFELKKGTVGWTVTKPFQAKTLSPKASGLPFDLTSVQAERFVAHQAKDLKKYGLETPFAKLTVLGKTNKNAHTLLVGDWAGKEKKQRYAKLAGKDAVFVIGDKLSQAVATTALDLLDTQLLTLPAREVNELLRKGDSPFTLTRKDDAWKLTGSPAPPFTADESVAVETVSAWANLRAVRFADYGEMVDWKKYGLDKPTVTLSIVTPDKKRTLAVGAPVKEESGERYVRLDQSNGVAVLAADVVDKINRTYLDFVNRKVLTYDIGDVKSIDRKSGNTELELARKDDVWHVVKPAEKLGDILNIEEILEKTYRLRAKRIAAYPAKDLKKFGLDKPAAVVTLHLQDPFGKASQHVIKVGESAGPNDGRYALIDKGTVVVVLGERLSKVLMAPPIHFRDHNLASFSSVDEVVLERRGRKAVFKKLDGAWKMTAPIGAKAEDEALGKFIGGLLRLRADELVSDDPKELKTFGLADPHTSWKFLNNGKEVLDLEVGAYELGKKSPDRCYASIGKSKLVFLLNKKLTDQALAEYRDRNPWKSLDAAQVDKLVYKGKDESFTLAKVLDKWRLTSDPTKTINEKAVTDTLDALASLKVERFITDKNGNLQLYGLKEPAVLSVEVHSGKDSRVLLIGRTEKDTDRRYVTVAGDADAPVFVISPSDVARIVRSEPAFVQKAKGKESKK